MLKTENHSVKVPSSPKLSRICQHQIEGKYYAEPNPSICILSNLYFLLIQVLTKDPLMREEVAT